MNPPKKFKKDDEYLTMYTVTWVYRAPEVTVINSYVFLADSWFITCIPIDMIIENILSKRKHSFDHLKILTLVTSTEVQSTKFALTECY